MFVTVTRSSTLYPERIEPLYLFILCKFQVCLKYIGRKNID